MVVDSFISRSQEYNQQEMNDSESSNNEGGNNSSEIPSLSDSHERETNSQEAIDLSSSSNGDNHLSSDDDADGSLLNRSMPVLSTALESQMPNLTGRRAYARGRAPYKKRQPKQVKQLNANGQVDKSVSFFLSSESQHVVLVILICS